jgi:thiamine-phosphate diphosphorylase
MTAHDGFRLGRSLVMLTDPDLPAPEATDRALAGMRGGATHVVVRRPNDTPASIFRMATEISTAAQGVGCRVLVHDRVDIALATRAHGAVLPLSGIPGGVVKERLLGTDRMLGISVHSAREVRAAMLGRADFLIYGNVYETESHPGRPAAGLDALAAVVENTHLPVIAIGGITPERVHEVLAAGASGVAVIRAISRATDPEEAARAFREALARASRLHHVAAKETS